MLWIRLISVFLLFLVRFSIINMGDVTDLCFLKNKMSSFNDHVYFLFMESLLVFFRVRAFKFRDCVSFINLSETAGKNFKLLFAVKQ